MGLLINPYRFAAPGGGGGGGFDPRSISGLVAWYSAESVTALGDSDFLTTLTDLSGLGNHALLVSAGPAPTWRSAQGAAGGAAYQFNAGADGSGSYFELPGGLLSTAAEVMTTVKPTGTGSQGFWSFGQNAVGNQSHFPFSDGNVYEAFGLAAGQRQSFAPSIALRSTWRRYNVWTATNDWGARLDETTQQTYASATPTFLTNPRIGRGTSGGGTESTWAGLMGAFVLYDRKLTTSERSDLATWLSANPSGGTP